MEHQSRLRSGLAWLSMGAIAAVAPIVAVGLAGAASAKGDNGDSYVAYSGTAASARSGEFLYSENHIVQYRDGKPARSVVLYTCRDGSAFARKTVSYVDNLSPDFLLEDASNGMREGIRTEGNVRKVFFRGDRVAAEKSSAMPEVNGLVADSGFDAFVRSNWQSLMSGQTLGMHFLVPSRLQDMNFKVQHLRSDNADGMPVEVFRLKVSGVLGLVVPSIDVYYGASDRNLTRYVGLSDLRDTSNDNFNAKIDFHADQRRPGDEQSLAIALRAHLAPCP